MDPSNPYSPPQPGNQPLTSLPPRPADDKLPPQAIVIEGCISKRDAREAFWLAIRPRKAIAVLGVGLIVVLFLLGVVQIIAEPREYAGYVLTLITLVSSVSPVLLPRYQTWRAFKNPRGLGGPHRRIVSAAGIESITPEAQTNFQWTVFSIYRRSQNVALICFAPGRKLFYVVPRAMFTSDADWQRFVELLEEKLPAG